MAIDSNSLWTQIELFQLQTLPVGTYYSDGIYGHPHMGARFFLEVTSTGTPGNVVCTFEGYNEHREAWVLLPNGASQLAFRQNGAGSTEFIWYPGVATINLRSFPGKPPNTWRLITEVQTTTTEFQLSCEVY